MLLVAVGLKHYKDLAKKEWNTYFYDPKDEPNYLTLEVNDKLLTIKTYKQDGTLLDTFFIDKQKDISSDSKLTVPKDKFDILPKTK